MWQSAELKLGSLIPGFVLVIVTEKQWSNGNNKNNPPPLKPNGVSEMEEIQQSRDTKETRKYCNPIFLLSLYHCLFHDPADVGNLISSSSAFSQTSLNIRKFVVHVLLKPGLEYYSHAKKN